jgi:ankyrin repeat protein
MRLLSTLTIAAALLCASTGCGVMNLLPGRTVHQRCGWKAEDYFTDLKVIALCHAIEANDLAEMERLVQAGADVNAQGRDKMTPLLWAFPDNHLPRFKWLLEHGANPNVVVEGEFNTRQSISRGDSVTLMVCKTSHPGYFEAVFENGGDPNMKHTGPLGCSFRPLFQVISGAAGDKKTKIKRLIELGADMNALALGTTPLGMAVGWGGQYDLAIMMLEAGANFRMYDEDQAQRLIHRVVSQERRLSQQPPEQQAKFHELVKWLEDHGESYEAAKADRARWYAWSGATFRQKMDAEIAERKARESAASAVDSEKPSEPRNAADSR